MIKPNISEIFCCTNSLVNDCVVSKTCILPRALKQSEVNLNWLEIRYTIQVAMETMFFFITQISAPLKKKSHCISGVPINNLSPIRRCLLVLGGINWHKAL